MAVEILGAVTGSLSAVGLFSNCVDCFEYVQLGRSFGSAYESCQLKLDVSRNRLSRWGEAVGLQDDPTFASLLPPTDSKAKLAKELLEEILNQFQTAERKSSRYQVQLDKDSPQPYSSEGTELSPVGLRVHNRLSVACQRQKKTSLAKKTYWALYDAEAFERLITQLSEYIRELEDLIPSEEARRQLAGRAIAELNDPMTLESLGNAARNNDDLLLKAVEMKMATFVGYNEGINLKAKKNSTARVGNVYDTSFQFPAGTWTDRTKNKGKNLTADDNSSVSVGTMFGTSSLNVKNMNSTRR